MKKIDEQELAEITELRTEIVDATYAIGQIAVQMHLLSERQKLITNAVSGLTTKEDELMKRLFEKYGVGSINYETGELTSEI